MVKITPKDIPTNFQHLVAELLELPKIKAEVAEIQQYSSDPNLEMTLSYEASGNGNTLFYIGYFDYWAVHLANGRWLRACIGYDDQYIQTVLEPKNYVELFQGKINSFNQVLPVFVQQQFS